MKNTGSNKLMTLIRDWTHKLQLTGEQTTLNPQPHLNHLQRIFGIFLWVVDSQPKSAK